VDTWVPRLCFLPTALRTIAGCGIWAAFMSGCALHGKGHTIDFSSLLQADRIVILTRAGETVKTVTDPAVTKAAAEFIQQYSSHWEDPLIGPILPEFMLHFYVGNRGLGGYGIGVGSVVANPPTAGFWSRPVPADDVSGFAGSLGLRLGTKCETHNRNRLRR
jgi:hypothetical protein